eukprot:TRINITY_DN25248_c0_g1_i1.p1 TRINITY_DN25248_c0_g1~~TRINITY_DN25248_c0_g1_i1.p1  ORF type:complete len:342 (+),score=47.67 TRINITY_DN25248_c0_g1_i1:134-1159(+)
MTRHNRGTLSSSCSAREFLESVIFASEESFQVAILQNLFPEKLGKMKLKLNFSSNDNFWSEGSWYLQDEQVNGLSKDLKDIGAESGDSLIQLAGKAANRMGDGAARQLAARRIVLILSNCAHVSAIPVEVWLPTEGVFLEAIKYHHTSIAAHLLKRGLTGEGVFTRGLQQAVRVGSEGIVSSLLALKADALRLDPVHPQLLPLGVAEAKGFSHIANMLRRHIQLHRFHSALGFCKVFPQHLVRIILHFIFTEEKEYGSLRAETLQQEDIKGHRFMADQGRLFGVGRNVQVKRNGCYTDAKVIAWHPSRDGVDEHYLVELAQGGRVCRIPFKRPGFEDSIRA